VAKTLVVMPTQTAFPQFPERYSPLKPTYVGWDGSDSLGQTAREWLRGLDVAYTAETAYDWSLPAMAADMGIGFVIHANPELLRPDRAFTRGVTWWSATPWRIEHLPAATRVVPMPVATERFEAIARNRLTRGVRHRPMHFLHPAGHRAAYDRNGTDLLASAMASLRSEIVLYVSGQDGRIPSFKTRSIVTKVRADTRGKQNYWDTYAEGDVMILPRRYGGNCLPVYEAMAAGLPVLMPDVSPNEMWPGPRIPVVGSTPMSMAAGDIEVADVSAFDVAAAIDDLAQNPGRVVQLQQEARDWAQVNSWEAMRGWWLEELERSIP